MQYTEEEYAQMCSDLDAIHKFNKTPKEKFKHFSVKNKYYYDKLMHGRYPNKPKGIHVSSYLEIELGIYSSVELRRKEKQKEYNNTYKVEIKECKALYYQNNTDYYTRVNKEWKINNKGLVNASNARRRAIKLSSTPSWANLDKIKEVYKNCPIGCHVDHIIPLQGVLVSGLHTESNLQYLSIKENLAKYNNFDIRKFNIGDYNTESIVWPIH